MNNFYHVYQVYHVSQIEQVRINIGFALINDKRMKELNRQYLGVDDTTDVLSFPVNEKSPDDIFYLGEIVVNKEQAKKQAKEYGVSFKEELARLITHGALHLLGYEDKTKKQREKMKDVENRIVGRFKV